MQDRPDPNDLLHTVAETLREKIMPALSGSLAFEVRVAANALDLVSRQLAVGAAGETAEHQRLSALLGMSGALPNLNRELCSRIRDGRMAADDARLKDHLWATTLEKLAVDQPSYAAYRAETK